MVRRGSPDDEGAIPPALLGSVSRRGSRRADRRGTRVVEVLAGLASDGSAGNTDNADQVQLGRRILDEVRNGRLEEERRPVVEYSVVIGVADFEPGSERGLEIQSVLAAEPWRSNPAAGSERPSWPERGCRVPSSASQL
jgi:hypothetical protein